MKTKQARPVSRQARRPEAIEVDDDVVSDNVDDTQFVVAAARAMQLLDAFQPGDEPLGNAELAKRTGLTKPTVSRLAYTLSLSGHLIYDQKRREYELGGGALALGAVAFSRRNVRSIARPLMRELADQGAFNIGLGTRDRQRMIYTDVCEGHSLVGIRLFAGSRMPILTSAMGRAYLAGLDPQERESIMRESRPQYGAEWPSVERGVKAAIHEFSERGFCVSAGDWQRDIHGVAAPIRSSLDGRVFAVNLGGPAYLLPVQELETTLGQRIAEMARAVEDALDRPRKTLS